MTFSPTMTTQKRLQGLTPREREIVETVARGRGTMLTLQEINLALAQAEFIGDL